MFAIEDKFGSSRTEHFTELGNKICIVCDSFGANSAVNSSDIFLEFKWKVCVQAVEPYRNVSNPTLFDYKYQEIAGASQGIKSYSNANLRQDLEIIDGVPTPKTTTILDIDGNSITVPVMIGNIDFWLKFGGEGIIQDLNFTLFQISNSDISTFVKL